MASNNQNPFADFFKAWGDAGKLSNFDWDKAIGEGRRNAQAFAEAAKSASEGAQAIARRQAEIVQRNAEEASKFLKEAVSSAKSPEASIAKQAEYTKTFIEAGIANTRELFELASKSNSETIDVFNKRISEALGEWSSWGGHANVNAGHTSGGSSKSKRDDKKDAA
jgi:phasin family protein